jgi:hypothetical protein
MFVTSISGSTLAGVQGEPAAIQGDGSFRWTGKVWFGPNPHAESVAVEGSFTSETQAKGKYAIGTGRVTWTAVKAPG